MPMLRAYGGRPSTRRVPKRISPRSATWKPATSRSSVVLPQPEGPSSVNSSPSATSSDTRSTASVVSNRFVTSRSSMIIGVGDVSFPPPVVCSGFLPDGLDVRTEAGLERLRAARGDGLVVDVGDVAVEIRADAARELDCHLGGGAGGPLHLVPGRDREQSALHEDPLAALGEQEL